MGCVLGRPWASKGYTFGLLLELLLDTFSGPRFGELFDRFSSPPKADSACRPGQHGNGKRRLVSARPPVSASCSTRASAL